jgi:hypothetical protein
MKLLRYAFFALTVLFTTLSNAQTADEIITKHLDAIGGIEAWKKVNSIITTGNLQVQGADVSVTASILHGKGMRQDIAVMGMTGYNIVTPTEGWNYMPFQGQTQPEALSEDDLKNAQDDLDAQGTLIDYREKGHTVEYLGKEDINGTETYKLKITLKGGKPQTIFIDPKTNYIIRSITKQKANGQEVEQTVNLSNYQKLPEGIVVPFLIGLPFGDMTVTKVEVNKDIDEKIFKPSN